MSADDFCRDIDQAEKLIGRLVDLAPERYFRYPMDMSSRIGEQTRTSRGLSARQRISKRAHHLLVRRLRLHRALSAVLITGDVEAQARLEDLHVQGAIEGLEKHAASARTMFGTNVPHIWMVHGTPWPHAPSGASSRHMSSEGAIRPSRGRQCSIR